MLYRKGFQVFYTTADVGLEVIGLNRIELIKNSFYGTSYLIGEPKRTKSKLHKEGHYLKVKKENFEGLIVNFLNEIIYFSEKYLCLPYEIEILNFELNNLEAKVFCLGRSLFKFRYELKAATYHNFSVIKKRKYIHMRIIFDI